MIFASFKRDVDTRKTKGPRWHNGVAADKYEKGGSTIQEVGVWWRTDREEEERAADQLQEGGPEGRVQLGGRVHLRQRHPDADATLMQLSANDGGHSLGWIGVRVEARAP